MRYTALLAVPTLAVSLVPAIVRGQDYGIDFVTVGSVGNASFTANNPPNPTVVGRGRVDYEYRIGRSEVTTGQWLEFINAYSGSATPHPYFDNFGAQFWGAVPDSTFPGPGRRYALRTDVANPESLPVFGITWRMSALFCNWLNGGKGSETSTLVTGAYDSTTWGVLPGTNGFGITDAPTHLPGARFWIPTLDEQMKAVHYDPDRFGPGQGGWWLSKNGSDVPGTPGLPGQGDTSAGLPSTLEVYDIPLGAYPASVSPWGLLDTSGGAGEWNEELMLSPYPSERGHLWSHAGQPSTSLLESIFGVGTTHPGTAQPEIGLRIASVVPSPRFCLTDHLYGAGSVALWV